MYDVISQIINHVWDGSVDVTEQQLIYSICGACIIIFTVVFIDLIYRVFRHFWR